MQYVITVQIADRHPVTRWLVQRLISKAASGRANKGFTDDAVRRGELHRFTVRAEKLDPFSRAVQPLVAARRVAIGVRRFRQPTMRHRVRVPTSAAAVAPHLDC